MTNKQHSQAQYLNNLNIVAIKENINELMEKTEKELLQLNEALLLNIYSLPDDQQNIEVLYIKNTIDRVLTGIYEASNFSRLAVQSLHHPD